MSSAQGFGVSPEKLYGQLTSGDAGGITEVATDLSRAKSSLRAAAETISTGARSATETWRGNAAVEFAATANDNTESAAEVFRRLHIVEAIVERAAQAYTQVQQAAEDAIQPWRKAKALDENELRELAKQVIGNLMRIRGAYEARLANLLSTQQDAGGGRGDGWDDDGNTDISGVGEDKPWIPQGLAYDGDNLLVTSYNPDEDGNRSRLTYVDHETGKEEKNVYLGGDDDHDEPTHSGGVATDGKHTWVSSNGHIYIYDKQMLDAAEEGAKVPAEQVVKTDASSYVTYADGKLWVGKFTKLLPGKLLEYEIDDQGRPVGEPKEHDAPARTQGVIVRDDEFVFSQSSLDTFHGQLVRQDRTPEWYDPFDSVGIPLSGKDGHAVEELVEVDGEIIIGHESGGDEFPGLRPPWIDPDDEPELTKIDLDGLGLDPDGALSSGNGYELDPYSLVAAAGRLDEAAAALTSVASSVSSLQLVGRVLGDVPAAEMFASSVTRHIHATGRSLQNGGKAVVGVADGLVASADVYRRLEDAHSSMFDQLTSVLG